MRSITDEQIDELMLLRKEHPKLSTPRLVEIAQGNGVFPAGKEVSMASIYRLMKIRKAQRVKVESDMRKFEVQLSQRPVAVRLYARAESSARREAEKDLSVCDH
jgi:hypothetical protein